MSSRQQPNTKSPLDLVEYPGKAPFSYDEIADDMPVTSIVDWLHEVIPAAPLMAYGPDSTPFD